mmetsp:Transcript_22986/g.41265  ORF Transcript_22986/g.41265 Transcript_22986/m.41265 type:complete len:90 (+) Transcript_22986:71-340(+)
MTYDDDGESPLNISSWSGRTDNSPSNATGSDEGSAADNTFGEDTSYAFTVRYGESLASLCDKSNASSNCNGNDDAMTGDGGMASGIVPQ